ncbi:MAG TPA: TonB-dependent receptor [Chitinophagales bacterium]|nr:TonB-dependent receptor [Chitinophagales bacterium]
MSYEKPMIRLMEQTERAKPAPLNVATKGRPCVIETPVKLVRWVKQMLSVTAVLIAGSIFEPVLAQVTNEEVIVVKEYEATIQDAQKVNISPNIPEVEETKPVLTYTVPSKDFKDISFEPNALKPLSMSKEKLEKLNNSFIKIGFGSQIMPMAQLAYNDNKTKNLKFGLFYNHLSAREFKVKNQRFGDDEAGVYLKYYPKTVELGVNFTFRNYRTHFYGINGDTTIGDSVVKAKTIRQVFRTYNAEVYFKNAQRNKNEIDYKQSVRFNYLQETFGKANEWFIGGSTDIKKTFLKNHYAGLRFDFDISRLKNDSIASLQRNIFTPMLGYGFNNDDWKAHGYIGVAVNGKTPVFVTDAHVEKRLYEHAIIVYASYERHLQKNSLLSHSQTNNFVHNWVDIKNTPVGNLTSGIKGTVESFSYNVAFHFGHAEAMPLYVNDTLDMKRFSVVYDSLRMLGIHFEAGYNMKEWLRLSVVGDYNIFQLKNQPRAWHEPGLRMTFRAQYIWKKKIVVGLDLYGVSATYARLAGGQEKKIKGTADLNLSLEYIMTKRISFFAGLNNIANIKYQRWNNYQSYGIIGWVGAKFSF